MFASMSEWQDRLNRRVLLIGEHWPASNGSIAKRDFRAGCKAVTEKWFDHTRKEAESCPAYVFIGEDGNDRDSLPEQAPTAATATAASSAIATAAAAVDAAAAAAAATADTKQSATAKQDTTATAATASAANDVSDAAVRAAMADSPAPPSLDWTQIHTDQLSHRFLSFVAAHTAVQPVAPAAAAAASAVYATANTATPAGAAAGASTALPQYTHINQFSSAAAAPAAATASSAAGGDGKSAPASSAGASASVRPRVSMSLTAARVFTHLLYFLPTSQEWWKGLGDEPTDAQDDARVRLLFAHLTANRATATIKHLCARAMDVLRFGKRLSALYSAFIGVTTAPATTTAVATATATATATAPRGNAVIELLDSRCTLLLDSIVKATKFGNDFSIRTSNGGDHYSLSFFAAAKKEQQNSLVRWMEWAEPMALISKELLLFGALLSTVMNQPNPLPPADASAAVKAAAASEAGYIPEKIVVCVENNLALSVLELLSNCGFVCRGFSGRAERLGVSVSAVSDPNSVRSMDAKFIEKSLALALQFPHADVNLLLCGFCGRGGVVSPCSACGTVKYCDVACQKADWKTHKPACKAAVAALGGAKPKTIVATPSAGPKKSKSRK